MLDSHSLTCVWYGEAMLRSSRVRKWIATAVLCVGMGAITALLVAWGCDVRDQDNPAARVRGTQRAFAWAMPSRNGRDQERDKAFFLGWSHPIAFGVAEIHAEFRFSDSGLSVDKSEVYDRYWQFRGGPPLNPTFRRVRQPTGYPRPDVNPFPRAISDEVATFDLIHVRQVGWPFRCLCQISGYGGYDNIPLQRGTLGISTYKLSARPLWPGLAANTGVYATCWAALLGLVATIFVLLRNPGRCTACGYDLQGLPVAACCPECGKMRPVR